MPVQVSQYYWSSGVPVEAAAAVARRGERDPLGISAKGRERGGDNAVNAPQVARREAHLSKLRPAARVKHVAEGHHRAVGRALGAGQDRQEGEGGGVARILLEAVREGLVGVGLRARVA